MRRQLVGLLAIVFGLAACDSGFPIESSDRGQSVVQLEGAVNARYTSASVFYPDSVVTVNDFADSVYLSLGRGLQLGFDALPREGTYAVAVSGDGTARVLYNDPVYSLVGREGTVTIASASAEELVGTFTAELNRTVRVDRFSDAVLRVQGRFRAVFEPKPIPQPL